MHLNIEEQLRKDYDMLQLCFEVTLTASLLALSLLIESGIVPFLVS